MKNQIIPDFYGKPTKDGGTFDFTDLTETVPLMGGVTSTLQSDPLYARGSSDWQIAIEESLRGDTSHVYWPQREDQLPHMMAKQDAYFDRAKELGNTMFRISLEMAWLCPSIGNFREDIMAEFVRMIARIKMRGMEPLVCLYHWPIPISLLKFNSKGEIVRGGWDNPAIVPYFRFYIEKVVGFLADKDKVAKALSGLTLPPMNHSLREAFFTQKLVRYFITINEPSSILPPGYLAGIFPPYKKLRFDLLGSVLDRLVEAHRIAYSIIKEVLGKETRIGVAHQWHYCEGILQPLTQSLLPVLSNEKLTRAFECTDQYTDFIGLQYYYRLHLTGKYYRKGKLFLNHPDLGDMYPPGLLDNLRLMHKQYPNKNIIITEFGFGDNDGQYSPYLILETMRYMCEAKREGIPVQGALLWTLAHNFEWACGMDVRFGLFKESDLDKRLIYSTGDIITNWEVWQACCEALLHPTKENLLHLQRLYEIAKRQFARMFP